MNLNVSDANSACARKHLDFPSSASSWHSLTCDVSGQNAFTCPLPLLIVHGFAGMYIFSLSLRISVSLVNHSLNKDNPVETLIVDKFLPTHIAGQVECDRWQWQLIFCHSMIHL